MTINNQQSTTNNQLGFTLIELLVVISLIGILATLVFANLNAARQRGRDAQRKADSRNIQTALRLYYNDNGGFPEASSFQIKGCGQKSARVACAWGGKWSTSEGQTYMEVLPKDPSPGITYHYEQTDSENYTLKACLENKSDDKCSTAVESWCTGCLYIIKP